MNIGEALEVKERSRNKPQRATKELKQLRACWCDAMPRCRSVRKAALQHIFSTEL